MHDFQNCEILTKKLIQKIFEQKKIVVLGIHMAGNLWLRLRFPTAPRGLPLGEDSAPVDFENIQRKTFSATFPPNWCLSMKSCKNQIVAIK